MIRRKRGIGTVMICVHVEVHDIVYEIYVIYNNENQMYSIQNKYIIVHNSKCVFITASYMLYTVNIFHDIV